MEPAVTPMVQKSFDELDADQREIADILLDGLASAQLLMVHLSYDYYVFQLAFHTKSDQAFFLLRLVEHTIVACSPLDAEALEVLKAGVPEAKPWENSGVAMWANKQEWTPAMGLHLRRVGTATWEMYDPTEGK